MSLKLAIIVNSDLNMSKGKIVAQTGHAMVQATVKAYTQTTNFYKWQSDGETIIAVKANLKTLQTICDIAERKGVVSGYICDAGRTEVAPGSITVGYVGPDKSEKIDKLVGQLKLL
jgi:PTH2 family peptidyl-tRNA hydrolase